MTEVYVTKGEFDRLVCVKWIDAWQEDGWHTIEDAHSKANRDAIVYSVGYVVKEDESGITLSSAVAKDGFGSLWKIPNGMIEEVTSLLQGEVA